ncbi:MAG: DUF1345 domain-containing protein [Novosphingobium sp.]
MTARGKARQSFRTLLGQRVAPPRFVLFGILIIAVTLGFHEFNHTTWKGALVDGFDIAVTVFIVSLWPLRRDHCADDMLRHSTENDANRGLVLLLTGVISVVVMVAMVAELPAAHNGSVLAISKLIATLTLGWLFANVIFALHYAHMFYTPANEPGGWSGGLEFPGTSEPDYWDFIYFSFTAGMSFAASDVNVRRGDIRRVLVAQCLLAFFFNIGALAFSINVLAGAAG